MRVFELFCGAGGMSLGLESVGFDVVGAYDSWSLAVAHYNANLGDGRAKVADLNDVLGVVSELLSLDVDMIVGGPPCQDFSIAGQREEATNAKLTLAFALIVATVRPRWFLMENVTTIARSGTWAEARAVLKRAGYGMTESKINASQYGVPQSRRRLIVVGRQGERDGFLASTIAATASTKPMAMRELFEAGEASSNDDALLANGFVYSRPVRAGRGVWSVDEPLPTVTRTSWERPTSRYLSAPHPMDPVLASEATLLTIEQISRIQGFPLGWRWDGASKRNIMQMIANAVPAPVAGAIGRAILDRDIGETVPAIEGRFVDWLVTTRGRSRRSAWNVKSLVIRARRLLAGRTFSVPALELAALECSEGFQRLPKNTQSDLRQALRLLVEYENYKTEGRHHRYQTRQSQST